MPTADFAETKGPTWRQLSKAVNALSVENGEWAGYPIPLPGWPLVLEPRYPHKLNDIIKPEPEPSSDNNATILNTWYSKRLRATVGIAVENGQRVGFLISNNQVDKLIGTGAASIAWPLEAEAKAIAKLAEMVRNHAFLSYMLTGSFIETSKRSGVSYIFRKLRPTLALRPTIDGKEMHILCALCLHPIGYYEGTWAGAMCPTDDLIAHLTMMRGDEPKYWANANQHPPDRPESGL